MKTAKELIKFTSVIGLIVCCAAKPIKTVQILKDVSIRESTAYYVGGEKASDSNPGTKKAPFATITKAAELLKGGETCYIRSGIYRETVVPKNSGSSGKPIVFTSDGNVDVTISGADKVNSGWKIYSGNIYKKTIALPVTGYNDAITGNSSLLANQVFVDGKMMIEARWPNISNSDDLLNRADFRPVPKGGWVSGATLTDVGIPDISGGWTGGTIWFLGWYLPNSGTITSSSPGQIKFPSNASDNKHDYYYLTGRLGALDAEKEWFYDGTSLYLWAPGGSSPANVEVKMRNYGLDLSDKSYITVRNISMFASTITTNSKSTNISLDRLRVQYNSHFVTIPSGNSIGARTNETGVRLVGANSVIKNSIIEYSAGNGIVLGATGCVAENNLVHDISYGGTYCCGIMPTRNDARQTITHNTIYRTGRSAIDGIGSNKDIGYNDIFDFGLINTDLGAIYSANSLDLSGTRIHHNWLHDAKNDKNHHYPVGAGIYLDQNAKPTLIDHNVFWNNHGNDIRIEQSAAPYNIIYSNTMGSGTLDFWYSFQSYPDSCPGNSKNNIYSSSIKPVTPGSNEITSKTNPLFVNPAAGGLGFRLQPGSPAIDAGTVITGVTDGYAGSAPDIGAYEYGGTEWVPGYKAVGSISREKIVHGLNGYPNRVHNIFAKKSVLIIKPPCQTVPQSLFEEYHLKVAAVSVITDFYEYEKQFTALHTEFGKQMLEQSLKQTATGRKKKLKPGLER
jgi:hypothetical protein